MTQALYVQMNNNNKKNKNNKLKGKSLLDAGGSHLSSQLLRKQRSGGLWFEASLGK
jgi:hypothetical protein